MHKTPSTDSIAKRPKYTPPLLPPASFAIELHVLTTLAAFAGSFMALEFVAWARLGHFLSPLDLKVLEFWALTTLPVACIIIYTSCLAIFAYREWQADICPELGLQLEAQLSKRINKQNTTQAKEDQAEDITQPLLGKGYGSV